MVVSFLHTSDWHIGQEFKSFPPEKAAYLRDQRLITISKIASLATQKKVAAVLVAGDIFDVPSVSDEVLYKFFFALEGFEGFWLLLPGNHDLVSSEIWSRLERFERPQNVVLLTKNEYWIAPNRRFVVLPAVIATLMQQDDPTTIFESEAYQTDSGMLRIGLAHGDALLYREGTKEYPIDRTRVERARLSYLALGHRHTVKELASRCWYCGTPERERYLPPEEAGVGQVLHVSFTEVHSAPQVEVLDVGGYQWIDFAGQDRNTLKASLRRLHTPDRTLVKVEVSDTVFDSDEKDVERWQEWQRFKQEWTARLFYFDVVEEEVEQKELLIRDLKSVFKYGIMYDTVVRLEGILARQDHPELVQVREALTQLRQIVKESGIR